MSQDERIPIVDRDDNVLTYKKRSDMTDDDCKRCVCIWVENRKGQVLLQQRSQTVKVDPGLWGTAVLGTVTDDDTYDKTATRELAEEIGITGFPLKKTNKLHYKSSFGWRMGQGYIVVCDWPIEKFKLQESEVAQVIWVDKKQIIAEITDKSSHTLPYVMAYVTWPELFNLAS